MIALAARPGTDVDPICSIRQATPPNASKMIFLCVWNFPANMGRRSTISMARFHGPPIKPVSLAPCSIAAFEI